MTVTNVPRTITAFRGAWSFLSNFHPAVLIWDNITYPTSEHAFNAGKTVDPAARQWVADAPTAREAKARGRSVDLRMGWDAAVRYQVMASVLHAKFTCRQERISLLLGTGDALLVEGNTWHDQHWGDCSCGRRSCTGAGANHLGRMLMELRAELAREIQ
jgi:ribA/ribD-fused uncharacterized protein